MKSYWLSENLWIIRYEQETSTSARIRSLEKLLIDQFSHSIVETVSTTTTLGIYLQPTLPKDSIDKLTGEWLRLAEISKEVDELQQRIVEIPVLYGGAEGPDLEIVARHAGLSEKEVIALHTSVVYPVQMIGFAPGFPYLAGLPAEIHAPRKDRPRERIEAGSVGIAGSQTGVYSIATPGGWQIIGRTATQLFLPHEDPPSLLQAGDFIRFVAIEREEAHA
ncbi:5-oxoprolinase subunit PxpB [Chryseomicrobium sp. FSL W7-1435]|uniref:5-oxoprolinase subunit PxpB n=1 Tax=Chryseomicrobium sp. FSL W7-1435 TaxID=2921704 RepID=UPI00315AF19E